jgi:phage tail tape-measure protein
VSSESRAFGFPASSTRRPGTVTKRVVPLPTYRGTRPKQSAPRNSHRDFDIKHYASDVGERLGGRVAQVKRLQRLPGIKKAPKLGRIVGKGVGAGIHALAKKHAPELVEQSSRPWRVKVVKLGARHLLGDRSATKLGKGWGEKAGALVGGALGLYSPVGFFGAAAGQKFGKKFGGIIGGKAGHFAGRYVRGNQPKKEQPSAAKIGTKPATVIKSIHSVRPGTVIRSVRPGTAIKSTRSCNACASSQPKSWLSSWL